jgi:hypothetical protein
MGWTDTERLDKTRRNQLLLRNKTPGNLAYHCLVHDGDGGGDCTIMFHTTYVYQILLHIPLL